MSAVGGVLLRGLRRKLWNPSSRAVFLDRGPPVPEAHGRGERGRAAEPACPGAAAAGPSAVG